MEIILKVNYLKNIFKVIYHPLFK